MLAKLTILIGCFSVVCMAVAHPGHDDVKQLDQQSAIEAASNKLQDLIEADKLSSTWSEVKVIDSQIVRIKGRLNWTVSYLDVESNQRLEFIFSLTGNFITFSKRALSETAAIH